MAQQTVGLFSKTTAAEDGYVLMAPTQSKTTYLLDKCGKQVHTWTSNYTPGFSAYMLDDGTMLRAGYTASKTFYYAGSGGIIQRFDWNSNPIWNYPISSATECQHHDICYLPNGNVLAIVWELKTDQDALDAGRDSMNVSPSMWPDKIVEYQPIGFNSANIVWEWHAWDHLVQDRDPQRANYGMLRDNPGKLDINHISGSALNPDWLHINSIAYNAKTDQILLSCFHFNEIWVIDHSTTTQEARGNTGGNSGKGGEILYRWGNPGIYGRGTISDQHFFESHDAHWIPDGLPDAGKIMVFNNGNGRPDGNYSSVEVIAPAVDEHGNYSLPSNNKPYGPAAPDWIYKNSTNVYDFFSAVMAGAERLPNGNTLICEATKGNLFEVTPTGQTVWKYINPVGIAGATKQGDPPQQNMVFRTRQYPATYAGFKGKVLVAGAPIEKSPLVYVCGKNAPNSIAYSPVVNESLSIANPFSNSIEVSALADVSDVQATLTNLLGMRCGHWSISLKAGQRLSLSAGGNLPTGMYLLHIADGVSVQTIKLIKE